MSKCDPEWHHGLQVDADYIVRAIKKTSDKFEHLTEFKDVETQMYSGSSTQFACCRIHLETAVHIMLGWHDNVRVLAVQSEA